MGGFRRVKGITKRPYAAKYLVGKKKKITNKTRVKIKGK